MVKTNRSWTGAVALLTFACGDPPVLTNADKLSALDEMLVDARQDFPEVEGLDVDRVLELYESGEAVFIDARTPAERAVSILPGAITVEEYLESPALYADRTPIAYCTIGYRSAELARRLSAEGPRVFNFEGSIVAWTHAGGALEGPDGPTRRVHVYGDRWNLVADGYEAIW